MTKGVDKTEVENVVLKNNIVERDISDLKYAPMLVKVIVYGLVGLILVAVVSAIIGLVVLK